MVLIAEGIPGLDFLETYRGANVSCLDEIDRVLLVGEHLHDTADTLFPAASYVQYIRTCIQVTAITPEEGQTTYERIGQDRKSTRLNSSHQINSYAVFCLKKKNTTPPHPPRPSPIFLL